MKDIYGIVTLKTDEGPILEKMMIAYPSSENESITRMDKGKTHLVLVGRGGEDEKSILVQNEVTIVINGKIFDWNSDEQNMIGKIFALYRKDRLDLVGETFGEFNITIMDTSKNHVYIISDYLAVRPIFYYWDFENFIFGSNVWPMISSGLIPKNLNLQSLSS